MNRKILLIALFALIVCRCQSQCDIRGMWLVTQGRIIENYEMAPAYSNNRITFSNDSIEFASGFFYNTLNLDSDTYALGRYPFVYYGKKEKYRVLGDTLFVYSKPYQSWNKFKMRCVNRDELRLDGKKDNLVLVRRKVKETSKACPIKYIKAHVDGGSLDLYNVNYKATYTKDDRLFFEQKDSLAERFNGVEIKLALGTFNSICRGFYDIDLQKVKKMYPTKVSDFSIIRVEIGLEDGVIIKSEIQNQECPEDLWIALIPVLYGHQQLLYSTYPPLKWK
ncbi:hypothetical protein [Chryseolinea lacunae]|uniref:Lipocalin-like domain-containing protein n=1 Tax=Chryseolinea lacunae TaxID=2801331 RepID=A0ABS1L3F2_9BACT|nr:hypothetical protein [Chryseolinea lacunae]MBL0745086.1 hypothetical protein [Chryseolinea lacunae]